MSTNAIQSSHIYSTYFAPRGRSRIYTLGMQIAQLYLSPFDQIIGFIGEAGSGKSVLIKGMFPGIELTNDDDGVNVRPLPLLEQEYETGFFTPHTYHLDIRFETASISSRSWRTPSGWLSGAASASSSSILT